MRFFLAATALVMMAALAGCASLTLSGVPQYGELQSQEVKDKTIILQLLNDNGEVVKTDQVKHSKFCDDAGKITKGYNRFRLVDVDLDYPFSCRKQEDKSAKASALVSAMEAGTGPCAQSALGPEVSTCPYDDGLDCIVYDDVLGRAIGCRDGAGRIYVFLIESNL